MNTGQNVYTPDEVRELLNIGRNTMYGLLKTGKIRSIKIGRIYRIPESAVEEYMQGNGYLY